MLNISCPVSLAGSCQLRVFRYVTRDSNAVRTFSLQMEMMLQPAGEMVTGRRAAELGGQGGSWERSQKNASWLGDPFKWDEWKYQEGILCCES